MLDMEITTEGFERTQRQIDALETDLRTKAVWAGLRAIAKPLRRDLASSLPVLSGALRSSIGFKTLSRRRASAIGIDNDDVGLEVGATRKTVDRSGKPRHQTYKLRYVSYGTRPHKIKARPGKFLKLHGGRFAREVDHPGIRAGNYVKKVYDAHQGHMQGLFVKGASAVLKKHGVVLQ